MASMTGPNATESNTRAYVILLIGIVALAFTAPWVRLSNFNPATSVVLRAGFGLLALLPFAIKEYKEKGGLNKTGVVLSIVAGLFLGIDFLAWNFSIYFVGSGIASVLLNLQIIILPAMAFFIDKERLPRTYFIVVPIMILGVLMTGGVFETGATTEGLSEEPPTMLGIDIAVLGTIAGSISGICYAIYLYTSRKATLVNKGQIVQPIAWATLAVLVAPLIYSMFSPRGLDFVHGVQINGVLPPDPYINLGDPITARNWFWVVVLGLAGQALTWTFVQYGAVRLNSTIVAGLLLLSPITTVTIIAVILFAEIPTVTQIAGVVVVLGAVVYQNGLHQTVMRKIRGDTSSSVP